MEEKVKKKGQDKQPRSKEQREKNVAVRQRALEKTRRETTPPVVDLRRHRALHLQKQKMWKRKWGVHEHGGHCQVFDRGARTRWKKILRVFCLSRSRRWWTCLS